MILTIDVKESAVDKIMYLLNHLKEDIKIIEKKEANFADRIRESEEDIKYGRVKKIEDVDKHIEELKNAIK